MQESKKTKAQILTEVVLERKIKKLNGVIPQKWWNLQEWKADYKRQIMAANSILKLFELDIILEALNTKNLNWIWTLTHKDLIPECIKLSKNKEVKTKIAEQSPKLKVDSSNVSEVPKQKSTKTLKDFLDE